MYVYCAVPLKAIKEFRRHEFAAFSIKKSIKNNGKSILNRLGIKP
jgi:hypothetical protein